MKIRSITELNSALDDALAWRKKEITTISLNVKSQKKAHVKKASLRASIPILYAHWEGFAKQASNYYIEFVARQHLTYGDLTTNFISISCWKLIKDSAESNQIHLHNQLIEFLLSNQSKRAKMPYHGVINTESNLSSKVLKNILHTIGLPYDDFWQKKSLAIDGKLLHHRNKIAHGEKYIIDETTFLELHDLVISALNYFKNSIENYAILKKYMTTTSN